MAGTAAEGNGEHGPAGLAKRAAAGAARSVAHASQTFANELDRDPDPVALPGNAVTAFFSANAVLLRDLASVVRDLTEECGPRRAGRPAHDEDTDAHRSAAEPGLDPTGPPAPPAA
ncbi:hypothetical protein [Streptomyces graminilatus]|uniref:hypothetical protein n=1 Tax=Streptomyces graminilatus TaxID=1464070 RepID=UPI0006E26E12|nr:hypothetical protein [Streptomyces graminilatus]